MDKYFTPHFIMDVITDHTGVKVSMCLYKGALGSVPTKVDPMSRHLSEMPAEC